MKNLALSALLTLALTGCTLFAKRDPATDLASGTPSITGPSELSPPVESAPVSATAVLGGRATSAEALDKTTAAEKSAALSALASDAERQLGKVVVALGPPAEQGLWLSTALAKEKTQGRVVTSTGKALAVELRPGAGGALLSLSAYQALGLALTDLPEVTIYGP